MSIGSFLVLELFVVIPSQWINISKVESKLHKVKGSGAGSMPYISVVMGVVFLLWFTIRASTSVSNAHGLRIGALQWTRLAIFCFGVLPFVLVSLYVLNINQQRMQVPYYLWLSSIKVISACYLLSMLLGVVTSLEDTHMTVFTSLMTGVWALCGLGWA